MDYATLDVPSNDLGVEQALLVTLRQFRDQIEAGWPLGGLHEQEKRIPAQVWIDSGYMSEAVYTFCREAGQRYRPAVGRGVEQQKQQWTNRQERRKAARNRQMGQGYQINHLAQQNLMLSVVDADHWKSWAHARLATPLDQPGAISFYQADPKTHLTLARHRTAEAKTEEYIAGRGLVTKWERKRRQNHWLDALYYACAAGHYSGVRLLQAENQNPQKQRRIVRQEFLHPNNGPFIDYDRWNEMWGRMHG